MPGRDRHKTIIPIGDARDAVGFVALAGAFFESLRVKNYSGATVENRSRYLAEFVRWCHERGIVRPREITKPILERYQRYLYHRRKKNGEPMSFRNQHSHLVAVRAFFRWLTRQNFLLYNPASEIDLPRLEHRLPRAVLTVHESEQVLAQPNVGDALGLRDRAILETFYSTGMRRSELIHLSLYDLDQERSTLMIRQGKGKKDRMVPIGERALLWIAKYLREARPTVVLEPDDGTLFLTQTGEPFSTERLSQLVREYVDKADMGKRGSCHLFRHTMATLMLEGGADIRFIQAMLGHAELSTTEIYTRVSIRKLQEIHAATHPGALLKPTHTAAPEPNPQPNSPPPTPADLFSALAAEAETEDSDP